MAMQTAEKQLGAAIASEVMGWTYQKRIYAYDYDGPFPAYTFGDGDCLRVWDKKPETLPAWREWAPWRDTNDMKEVVEAVRAQKVKCWVHITNICLPPDYIEDGWNVIFHEYGKPLIDRAAIYGHAQGKELEKTALEAGLKAVRNER